MLGTMSKIICNDSAELFVIKESSSAEYENVSRRILEEGYLPYSKRMEGDVEFSIFTKGNQVLYLSYTPGEKCVRVILKENAYLPEREESSIEKNTTPLITQVRNAYFSMDCGMSYVIRTCDGRFVLIDGGIDEYEDLLRYDPI